MPTLLWLVKFMNNPVEFLLLADRNGAGYLVLLLVQCDAGSTLMMLHLDTIISNATAVRLLLSNGADNEAKNKNGFNAFHLATRKRCMATTQLLIDHGANLEATDSQGRTALHIAVFEKHKAIIRPRRQPRGRRGPVTPPHC
jgi:ankyrin repeat protein